MELAKSASALSVVQREPFIVMSITGKPSEDRVLAEIEGLLSDSSALPEEPVVLCDNRGFERLVSRSFIDRVLEAARTNVAKVAGGRVALVAGSTAQFGMQRMFTLRAEELPFEAKAFQNVDDARQWLSRGSD